MEVIMPLMNSSEFLAKFKTDPKKLERELSGNRPTQLCGCGKCADELEPRNGEERPRIDGKEVNADCYYEALGDLLEQYPIIPPRVRRRG
jgi:hypothetical protein